MEADQLDITLADPRARLALPRRGVVLALGWEGRLTDKGRYTVDEVGEDGPPDVVTIVARAADFRGSLKDSCEASYHDTTLGAILGQIAACNGLTAAIHPKLAAVRIGYLDQTSESDANLVTRLGEDYGATATVHHRPTRRGRPPFLPRHRPRRQPDRHPGALDRPPRRQDLFRPGRQEGSTRTLKRTYPNKAEAQAAAEAAWNAQKSQAHEFQVTLSKGRADLLACSPLRLTGWRPEITRLAWRTGDVTHALDADGGFTTDLTATKVVAD